MNCVHGFLTPNSYVETLTQGDVIWRWGLWEVIRLRWGHEGVSQVALMVKNLLINSGNIRDKGSIPGSGRSPGGGLSNSLQCSCLENPKDRRACQATLHRVAKSQAHLKQLSMHTWCHEGGVLMMGLPTCSVGKLYPTFVTCHGVCPSRFLCPWDFLGKNTGMACHFLLQEDLLMQGLNLGILPASPALAGRIFTTEPPRKPMMGLVPL